MERRQFITSLAAAASTPLLPAGVLPVAKIPASLYASAVSFVSGGAYFSATYLKSSLGLDDALGKAVVSRLKQEGLVGDVGRSGVMFSKTYYAKHIELAAKAVGTVTSTQVKADLVEKVKDVVSATSTEEDSRKPLEVGDAEAELNLGVASEETVEDHTEI